MKYTIEIELSGEQLRLLHKLYNYQKEDTDPRILVMLAVYRAVAEAEKSETPPDDAAPQ